VRAARAVSSSDSLVRQPYSYQSLSAHVAREEVRGHWLLVGGSVANEYAAIEMLTLEYITSNLNINLL